MLTRRTAIGTGLASMALAAIGSRAKAKTKVSTDRHIVLVEASAVAADRLSDGLTAIGMTSPVRTVMLDAPGYAKFKFDLASPGGIIGVTSRSTMFCLGQIAADHGYRLVDTRPFCLFEGPATSCDSKTASVLRVLQTSRAVYGQGAGLHVWTLLRTARGPLEDKGRAA